jgi:hypothetical protein
MIEAWAPNPNFKTDEARRRIKADEESNRTHKVMHLVRDNLIYSIPNAGGTTARRMMGRTFTSQEAALKYAGIMRFRGDEVWIFKRDETRRWVTL